MRAVAGLGLVAVVCGTAWTAAPTALAQSDPVAEADAAVATARQRADEAANAYLRELSRSKAVDTQIDDLHQGITRLEHRVERLRATMRERAAAAYERAGQPFPSGPAGSGSEMDDTRRIVLLDTLNQRDRDAAASLRQARDELDHRRRDLETAKQQQSAVLERLKQEEQQLNAELGGAQEQRRRVAEQQAQRQATAAAAAPAPTQPAAPPAAGPPAAAAPSAPAPSPAPSRGYAPTPGSHPRHDDPFLVCTRTIESGGNYQAYNPSGPYYGAYQFLQSSWNATANHAGRGDLVGLEPRLASEYDQDDMAWTLYQWQGKGPWGGRC